MSGFRNSKADLMQQCRIRLKKAGNQRLDSKSCCGNFCLVLIALQHGCLSDMKRGKMPGLVALQ